MGQNLSLSLSDSEFELRDSFENTQFKNLSYFASKIVKKEFYRCEFNFCKLQEVSFAQCRFDSCQFCDCDMSIVKLLNSGIFSVRFERCKLVGIDWAKAAPHMSVEFATCNLSDSTFFGLDLSKTPVTDCALQNVDFSEANLSRGIFRGSDFNFARFNNTNLSAANFVDARNYSINPNFNRVKKARFSLPEAISLLSGLDIVLEG